MNNALEARAEILKLARVLRRDPAQLEYLEQVPATDIRALREQVTDVLFDSGNAALSRLASASRVLPVGLLATIGERSFGPVLSARITGLLEPGRAVEVAERLPTSFLADVALELDPRRTSAVIARIPPRQIAEITTELVRRGEYVMMGRFVGHLSDQSVVAAVGAMDDKTLLQVAFVLESTDGLDDLLDVIGEQRLNAIIDTASREKMWIEVLGLFGKLSEERRAELAAQAETQDPEVLESIVRVAADQDLWTALLPLAPMLAPDARQRVACVLTELAPERREQLTREAHEAGFADELELLENALSG